MIAVDDPGVALGDYPGFLPGLAFSMMLGLVVCGGLARRLGVHRVVAWTSIVSLGAILAATLTPSPEVLILGSLAAPAGCDLSRIGPATWTEYLALGTAGLNVLLFIPFGVFVGLLPHSRPKTLVVVGAVVLPVSIEALQLLVWPLGRACQSADVFDNLIGLTVGLAIGLSGEWIGRNA